MADDRTRTEQFPVRLTKKSKALLQKLANADDRSMNDIVILAINDYALVKGVSVTKRGKGWV